MDLYRSVLVGGRFTVGHREWDGAVWRLYSVWWDEPDSGGWIRCGMSDKRNPVTRETSANHLFAVGEHLARASYRVLNPALSVFSR